MSISPKLNAITQGDVLSVLQSWPDAIVQTVVTSPPYWGLRDYNVDGQIGLEPTPAEFVDKMVRVFREVRRVLKKDGTIWLNIGDTYVGGGRGGVAVAGDKQMTNQGSMDLSPSGKVPGLKSKDLCGIPWRVALALQADGWYLRSDIIWSKPNPMPESVADRPTKAHEYIFFMTKSSRYFYDAEAIKEPAIGGWNGSKFDDVRDLEIRPNTGRKRPSGWGNTNEERKGLVGRYKNGAKEYDSTMGGGGTSFGGHSGYFKADGTPIGDPGFRNKRSVWEVPTQAFTGAHFATFPEDLIAPCIKAGSRAGDVVLDPFMGSGTTAVVAKRFKRNWLGIDLNPVYIEIANRRISVEQEPLLVE